MAGRTSSPEDEDSYFGSSPHALDPATAIDQAHPALAPKRRRARGEGDALPASDRPDRRGAILLAVEFLPGLVASLAAIPRLRGYEAATVGLMALVAASLPAAAWFTPAGRRTTPRQRVVYGIVFFALAAATALAARHVDGLVQIGLGFGALFLGALALVLQVDQTRRDPSAEPPPKRLRFFVVLRTVVIIILAMFTALFVLALLTT